MKLVRQQTKKKEKKLLDRFKKQFTPRQIIIGLIALVVVLILSNIVKGILLMVIFFPMALYSARVTKFVNGVTLETSTASSILMAFLYGPSVGALVAFVLTTYSYVANSIVKLRAYLDIIYTTATCFITGYFTGSRWDFGTVFVISIIIKNAIAFFFNHFFFDSDKVGNIVYRVTHLFLNIFIYKLFFVQIYYLFNMI